MSKPSFNLTRIALSFKNNKQSLKKKKSTERAKRKRRNDSIKIKRYKARASFWEKKYKEEKSKNKSEFGGKKIKHHSYCSAIITLALILHTETSMSLRDSETVLRIFIQQMHIDSKCPDHSTIDNWLKKAGMQAIEPFSPERPCVLICDESISFNGKKLFLVLAVPVSVSDQQRTLRFEDCHLVYLGAKKGWSADVIYKELQPLVQKLKIQYVLSDKGSNLLKATALLGLDHVSDITHEVSRTLKNLYNDTDDYKNFIKWVGELRKDLACGEYAHLAPPKVRHHCRFHQLGQYEKWFRKVGPELKNVAEESKGAALSLLQISDHTPFIKDLISLTPVIKEILSVGRTEGISHKTILKLTQKMEELEGDRPTIFREKITHYFHKTYKTIGEDIPFCCSAIIESVFGKYKSKMSSHPQKMCTNHLLTIPLFFVKENEISELVSGFDTVKVAEIKDKEAVAKAMMSVQMAA
ncbi:hypothetical protein PEPS_29580 (plasmid) [Persicobacter psychrovividus]|uniref:Uncharacterized protein n=1 Tax=Persicobacter psychrovividus TaxID=387638 RepID=A0ABN6LBT7_9BACT|nr:hypothetical protein PEPS_29580 [Persicobacter psychrovividus]